MTPELTSARSCDPDEWEEDDVPINYPDTPEVEWSPPATVGVLLDHTGAPIRRVEEMRAFGFGRRD